VEFFSVGGNSLIVSHLGLFKEGRRSVVGFLVGLESGRSRDRFHVLLLGRLVVFVLRSSLGEGNLGRVDSLLLLLLVLNNGIVGYDGLFTLSGSGSEEESGTHKEMVPLDRVVSLDDLGVDVRDEEESGQKTNTGPGTHDDGNNVLGGLLVETEGWRSLVDNRQSTDGSGDEEEEGRSVDCPRDRVLSDVDDKLDQQEDGGTETSGNSGCHTETGKDGSESFSFVPSPLNLGGTDGSDSDTGDGGNERVGGRDVGRVSSTPHDPGGSTSEGTGESEHLDTGVTSESRVGNDTVLDGIGSSGTDG
jgi:hypothetical protein